MTPQQRQFIADLYETYFSRVNIYIITILGDQERAKDIVQDVFHEAIKHVDTLMAHKMPFGWLKETAKWKIYASNRALQRCLLRFVSLDADLPEELYASVEDGFERVEGEVQDPIALIRKILTDEEFYLLKCIAFDRKSHLAMAKELNISVWASQKRLERIRKKLRPAFFER